MRVDLFQHRTVFLNLALRLLRCTQHLLLVRAMVFVALTTTLVTATYSQTQIGGIINSYYEVTTVVDCDSAVAITDPQGLSVGDKVLILQMKGALINETNDSTYGDLVSLEAAGCVEFMTIKDIRGTTVEFASKFVHRYRSEHKVQMVRVPMYTNAVVTADITAKPWDGTKGGVIVFEVAGTLTLNADINADSMGFRGGIAGGTKSSSCDFTEWTSPYKAGHAGAKGESVVNQDFLSARGKLLSGGGGGNGNNAGGGGGGNGGAGGEGGLANVYCTNLKVGGTGGRSQADLVIFQRLFFGAGGGGGHQNRGVKNSLEATSGANGGGLVLIRATTIIANNRTISANGDDMNALAGWDGAGGGGAGGTVYIETESVVGPLHAKARGGTGGSIGGWSPQADHIVYQASGPGGGGGGGIVILPKTLVNIIPDLRPGICGTHVEPRSTHYLTPRGAAPGEPGAVITKFTWAEPKRFDLEAGGDSTICPVGVAMLWAKSGFLSYRWSTGDTDRITTISAAGTYYVDAVDSIGCVHRVDNIQVVVDPTHYQMDASTDFGSCDLNVTYLRTIRYVNTDDEYAVIRSISVPAPFAIVSPVLPAVIPPGAGVDIVVSLVAVVEGELEDTLRLDIQSPCVDSAFAILRSTVNPVYSNFVVGSTIAHVGDLRVKVPVMMRMLQDSTHLDNVTLRFDLTMDSRAFAPTALSRGRRLRDLLDFVSNKRTVTIEIDSVYIRANEEVLTVLEGTVLNSGLPSIPVDITNLKWVVASRDPITTVTPGAITVIGGCYADSRMVRFIQMPSARLHPNPASDNVTIDVEMTLRGEYIISIYDVQGRSLFKYTDYHVEDTPRIVPLKIPVDQWESGSYVVMFNSPAKSQAFPLAVVK